MSSKYLSPGIYKERLAGGYTPVQGVATATLVVPGYYPDGPTDEAIIVTSWAEFERKFGGLNVSSENAYAIKGFFDNGGKRVIPLRAVNANAAKADSSSITGWIVEALYYGVKYNDYSVVVTANEDSTTKFDLEVKDADSAIVENFISVYLDAAHADDADYVKNRVNEVSQVVTFTENGTAVGSVTTATLSGGLDGTAPSLSEISTLLTYQGAGCTLDKVLGENFLLIAPDFQTAAATNVLITYAEARGNAFVIYGGTSSTVTPAQAKTYRGTVTNSQKSAMYWPAGKVYDSVRKALRSMPIIGHIAGVYARTDATRNVGKNPAGVIDGRLMNVSKLNYEVSAGEMDTLYPARVNPVLKDAVAGIVVWGCRTTSIDPEWIYINHERLFQYVENMLDMSTKWVNFENNTDVTRLKLYGQVSGMLSTLHNNGYFAGANASESFFVICDSTNNPEDVAGSGELICDVGMAPGKPSEFVRFRLRQKTLK